MYENTWLQVDGGYSPQNFPFTDDDTEQSSCVRP